VAKDMIDGEAYVEQHNVRAQEAGRWTRVSFDDMLRSSFLFSHARSLIAKYIITFHITGI
jgi:hypothetical protein